MRAVTVLLLIFSICIASVRAETPRFELSDGTVITGTVSEFANGVYTVKSASLGTIHINQKDIRSIVYGGQSQVRSGGGADAQAQIQAIQTSLAQDPGMMSLILALQNDPAMQAILADPEITRAVAAGDVSALLSNKKIIELMEDPRIKAIVQRPMGVIDDM